ncbi:SUMF1/EgtB/PvdO family nonheme iron enzyme [Herminiimonas sp. CN]|uniref:SUMF1/EgtB/PvdO family nonheme iron enzyme n=1 Tax=Herminiimonas sp. CN TaxID=1349818 RepID=UPI000473C278|nr:SUMF1/EgtB/PvdO family nonheme iron enzyme [Herminiimonas sp. CN]
MAQAHNTASSLKLTEERTFTAHLQGRKITGLEVASEWEGLTKFLHPASGQHMIVLMAESRIVTGSVSLMQSLGHDDQQHWVTVPERVLPSGLRVPSFQYAKYPCSKGAGGKIVLSPSEKPWVNIKFAAAVDACTAAGYQLARESQELAIRLDVCEQDINWAGGKVGQGKVFQGLHKGTVSSAQTADFVSSDTEERSWHQLSNGERVYGLAGNVYTWVHDDIQGNESGLIASAFAKDSASIATAPYPSKQKGMGYIPESGTNWSGYALVRGGCWDVGDYAGVFRLYYVWPDSDYDSVGFRCTTPISL